MTNEYITKEEWEHAKEIGSGGQPHNRKKRRSDIMDESLVSSALDEMVD